MHWIFATATTTILLFKQFQLHETNGNQGFEYNHWQTPEFREYFFVYAGTTSKNNTGNENRLFFRQLFEASKRLLIVIARAFLREELANICHDVTQIANKP